MKVTRERRMEKISGKTRARGSFLYKTEIVRSIGSSSVAPPPFFFPHRPLTSHSGAHTVNSHPRLSQQSIGHYDPPSPLSSPIGATHPCAVASLALDWSHQASLGCVSFRLVEHGIHGWGLPLERQPIWFLTLCPRIRGAVIMAREIVMRSTAATLFASTKQASIDRQPLLSPNDFIKVQCSFRFVFSILASLVPGALSPMEPATGT